MANSTAYSRLNDKLGKAFEAPLNPYPACHHCNAPVCGEGNICQCAQKHPHQEEYQREYLLLRKEIRLAERAPKKLENSPFRQLRNSFGFGTSIVGGLNILLTHIIALTATIAVPILVGPATVLGIYVYFRGRREEKEMNADAQAELLAKKTALIAKHLESVQQRHAHPSRINPANSRKMFFLKNTPVAEVPKSKEKRGLIGNPFSHFVVSSLATFSVLNTIIKLTLAGVLLGAAGPIIWASAAASALLVGTYFAYTRYQYLISKKNFEKRMGVLAARTSDVETILENTKKLTTAHINEHLKTLASENEKLKNQVAELQAKITPPVSPSPAVTPKPAPSARKKSDYQAANWNPSLHKPAAISSQKKSRKLERSRPSVQCTI